MMGFSAMLAQLITLAILVLSPTSSSAANPTTTDIAKRGCDDHCGNVRIPYPFGMKKGCYLDEFFFINCNHSFNPPKAFLGSGNVNVTDIFLDKGQMQILNAVSYDCYDRQGNNNSSRLFSLRLPKFTVSNTANKFIAVGCDTYAIVRGFKGDGQWYTAGCISLCDKKEAVSEGTCSGAGCCQLAIPEGTLNLRVRLDSYYNHKNVSDFNPCSYALVAQESEFTFTKDSFRDLAHREKLPLVLDWSIGYQTCEVAQMDNETYACKAVNSTCTNLPPVKGSGYICNCSNGYQGNPYLLDGCQDREECKNSTLNKCRKPAVCNEIPGNYTCTCPKGYHKDDNDEYGCIPDPSVGIIKIALGVSVGITLLLVCSSLLHFGLQKRNLMKLKEKYFQQNGGFMLQQRLSEQEISTNIVKIFTSEELEKATNKYNESRIIGRGGFGTVYKGYLFDKRVVAIKKSKMVEQAKTQTQIEQFINEVVILSKINHRNVVKLLGCCLETEVPLLVYEFINNGTLFEHIHNKVDTSALSWDTRLRIAVETAGVLSYLHSAASTPIIHRDIKSTNILLDDNYVAKVSDFGASRLVPLDHTQISTMVQGTLGYLDPEYMQTSQLTEKSDVYSFGVVLVELLTGQKAVFFDRSEEQRSLAMYFISSVKEDRLFQVLEEHIVREGNTEQLKEVAMLANRCLKVKGEDRPSMKEVAMELEGLRLMTKHPWVKTESNSEETESLLGETSGVYGYSGGTTSTINAGYDSMRDHIIVPTNDGR